jgi:transcriptional regulator with GAF, ATPase, and Fis domain
MRKLAEKAAMVAPVSSTVLILGETGTGKEMFARLIHTLSQRRGPFIPLNCGSIPSELVESTLFGHMKGAFTGAIANRVGAFDQADKGTLFLDEVGELPAAAQVKFLRVLQDQIIQPLGAASSHQVDVRVIAATNRDLLEEVKAKQFREDLYYRLCPLTLTIPPLRQRRSEIVPLAISILERLNRSHRRQRRFSPAALQKLNAYPWPGNVRQLEGVLITAVILSPSDLIQPEDLDVPATLRGFEVPEPSENFDMEAFLDDTRMGLIDRALAIANGNQSQAARLLGTSPQNISKTLKNRRNSS